MPERDKANESKESGGFVRHISESMEAAKAVQKKVRAFEQYGVAPEGVGKSIAAPRAEAGGKGSGTQGRTEGTQSSTGRAGDATA